MEIWLSWTAVSVAAVTCYWLKLHYSAKHGRERESSGEVKELRAEVQEMYDDLTTRIEQLHERMDFTERVLAERANQARIEPPRAER
ncbi:MAG: hypothetical protein ACREMJ_03065 [Gemmatimonadales bacterium]